VRLAAVKNPADFFVPILGLLTGSRPASICQLRVGDIRREDGITVIHYHDYLEGNSAKTRATNRIAPLHPLLEQVGFLRYLEDVKSLPDTNATTLIFPWLNQYEQGFADVPTQNFREVLKKLGIYVPNVKVFLVLLTETSINVGRQVAEKLRLAVSGLAHTQIGRPVTVSCGIAQWRMDETRDEWLARADKALYRAKEQGRNRTCVAIDQDASS
jgi:hypothetical protein